MEKSGFLMITLLIESSFRLKTGKHVSTYPTPASPDAPTYSSKHPHFAWLANFLLTNSQSPPLGHLKTALVSLGLQGGEGSVQPNPGQHQQLLVSRGECGPAAGTHALTCR